MSTVFNLLGNSSYLHFDLDAVVNNVNAVKKHYPDAAILAVVKANAYGNGAIPIARLFKTLGVARLGVATLDEGVQLRKHGVDGPIHVFGNTTSFQMAQCLEYELLPTVADKEAIQAMAAAINDHSLTAKTWRSEHQKTTNTTATNNHCTNGAANITNSDAAVVNGCNTGSNGTQLVDVPYEKCDDKTKSLSRIPPRGSVVIKVDSGMWRNGCTPQDLPALAQACRDNGVPLDGVYTHFAESFHDDEYTQLQINKFTDAVKSAGLEDLNLHASNTGAVLKGFGTDLTLIRPGHGLYGLPPGEDCAKEMSEFGLRTLLEVCTTPTVCKLAPKGSTVGYGRSYCAEEDQWLSVLPYGYCDGYPRMLSNKGQVRRKETGELCPVVGRVSMDSMVVRTHTPTRVGEVFQVITRGYTDVNSLENYQVLCDTTASDIVIKQSLRLPRVYTLQGRVHCVYQFNQPIHLPKDTLTELGKLLCC